jgi:hypothetical protein
MRNLTQIASAVGVATVVAGVLAACGGGSSGGTSPAAASTPTAAASAGSAQAYFACLQQHGANIPTSRPTNFTRPTDRPSGGFSRGGGGGGFFGGGQSQSPQMQAAMQACVSVRPTSGFGGGFGGGRGGTALVAFRNCMTQQGVTVPTARPSSFPTARPTDNAARYLGGLDPNDPKVAAALKVCSPLLPSPGARPSGAPTS